MLNNNQFAIQRLNPPDAWVTVAKNSRSLVAYGLIGRMKNDKRDRREVRVIHVASGNIAEPPDIGRLASWLWLRGDSETIIDAACAHINAIQPAREEKKAA